VSFYVNTIFPTINDMNDLLKDERWFSINLDDSVSAFTDSFDSAFSNKSVYIVQRTYNSCSWSGNTIYHRYRLFSPVGELVYPSIGNCAIKSETVEWWYRIEPIDVILTNRENSRRLAANYFPLSSNEIHDVYTLFSVCDNKREARQFLLSNFKESFWVFLKSLSRAECWNEYFFLQCLNLISKEVEDLHADVTKYGYSKKEYAFEYCYYDNYEISSSKEYLNSKLIKLQEELKISVEISLPVYVDKNNYFLKNLTDQLSYISQVLKRKKPWRK
jgi:hypothetical protein